MANSILSGKVLQNEAAAIAWVEARVWPEGPVCPHCGNCEEGKIGRLNGKTARPGLRKCYACRKQFTVKVGTVFEDSHVPMHLWLQAMYLLCSSKKGISSNQLSRTLGVTLKTAWFMSHRIREAMRYVGIEPLGGEGKTVEADETFIGRRPGTLRHPGAGTRHKYTVLSLIERGGRARSFHIDGAQLRHINPLVDDNVAKESVLSTDERLVYRTIGREFARHDVVNHEKDEYVRGDAHVNTAEGYFSIFKRGMKGIYQHCGEKHLHRYLAEFDFRYSNRVRLGIDDVERTARAVKGIVGKRLTYATPRH
jgi:transposase-like protein